MSWIAIRRLGFAAALVVSTFSAQTSQAQNSADANKETETGIPVTDALVIEKCGACHAADDKGNLSRISWERTTPEGWAQAIRRMVRLNGLVLTPEESRAILRSLSASHGLAPEEAKPVMYVPERRIIDETFPNDQVKDACARCHEFGKALSWRRSKNDWKLLQNMHVAMFAQAEVAFRGTPPRGGAAGSDAAPPKKPGDAALDFLNKSAGLHSPQWAEWRARMRSPRLAGSWLVSASMPGRGKFVGTMTIAAGPTPDDFKTDVTLKSLTDGSVITRSGTGIVYAGYSWRGRSKGAASPSTPDSLQSSARETLWFSPDQSFAEGRWYWGEYHEFGFDVKLQRGSGAPAVLTTMPEALKAGAKNAQFKLVGTGFPDTIAPADIYLGSGVTVNKVTFRSKTEIIVDVSVDADAISGKRDVSLGGGILESAFAVYRKVDRIAVTPEKSLSRLGSDVHPKGYQQFEALGYENGADGKPNTGDDIALGPLSVDWSVEEFLAVYGDDDKDFVGEVSKSGLFTPASDGPNEDRRFGRNNYGEVWVVATSKTEKASDGAPLAGRSRLVVTVPLYIRWDQPEVSQ